MSYICLISDWFPGWISSYGAEPSSKSPSEDCVELRQSFPGLSATPNYSKNEVLSGHEVKNNQLYWSDQECRKENWFICAKAMIINEGGETTFSSMSL